MSGPNFCDPCGHYHSRDWLGCIRFLPPPPPPAVQVPIVRDNVVPAPPVSGSPAYVAGWNAGWAAAMADKRTGRTAA
jgi:hypothetical protein